MQTSRFLATVATFALFIASAQAAAPPNKPLGSPNTKKGGVFRFAINVPPQTLNPLTAHDNYALRVMWWMTESLLARNPETFEWESLLAIKHEISKDGKMFTFDLRPGVRFHDGGEFTAKDVKFSFDVYKTDLYAGAEGRALSEDIESVEVLSPLRVRFRMKRRVYSFLEGVATTPIVSKAFYGEKANVPKAGKQMVATGPYRLKEYVVNDRLTLEANPNWWGKGLAENARKHNFDTISVRFPSDETAKQQMVESGQLDYAGVTLAHARKLTTKPWGETAFLERAAYQGLYGSQTSVFWNLRRPLFKSRDLRRALQLLLDRKSMNETMRGGQSLLATGPWHRLSEYAEPGIPVVEYDPTAAKALLAKDGWRDADGDGVLEKTIDGKRVDFRWTVFYPKRDWEPYLTTYQSDLKKVGIQLEIRLLEWGQFNKAIDEKNFDAFLVGRGFPNQVDFNPGPEWRSSAAGPKGFNQAGYQNPEVDKLFDAYEVELNRAKRVSLLRAVFRIMADDANQLLLFSEPTEPFIRSSRLRFEKPAYKYLMGMDYWWIE